MWHVARFTHGWEERAARALSTDTAAAFCPLEQYSWVAHGKKRSAVRPVIGGCIFVEGAREPHRWHDIAKTEGFISFMGSRQEYPDPVQVQDTVAADGRVAHFGISTWLERAGDTWIMNFDDNSQSKESLQRGDIVRLRSLKDTDIDLYRVVEMAKFIFRGLEPVGTIVWVQGDGTAWVTFRGPFNRETRISISARALEKVPVESKRQRLRLSLFK